MLKNHHAYKCETGCGHTTIIDKFYKTKRVFCGVCGTKDTVVYQGECQVEKITRIGKFKLNAIGEKEGQA
ncbi:hypothetical protein COF80_33035 [Bacillus toyonensis]|uniref:hypothetical protein n=1 Tax=Bacillus toyonensis TaxID=155322 RepID=UPI000BFDD944|nr:hypothetical protein [Bacillus toyonensis]PHE74503.1 hypothetical protein COF80_33035 [Bacillus toyonensis]